MSDLTTAQQMVEYYKHMPARIRSQPIHVQYSMHERLKVCGLPELFDLVRAVLEQHFLIYQMSFEATKLCVGVS